MQKLGEIMYFHLSINRAFITSEIWDGLAYLLESDKQKGKEILTCHLSGLQ